VKRCLEIGVYKKSDKTVCSKYCSISLLNVAYKIFSKILARRLEPYTEKTAGGVSVWVMMK
jgi:hypothetical protein